MPQPKTVLPGVQPAGAGIVSTPGPDEETAATLIISKYTCEPAYEFHAPDADPADDCQELTETVLFLLSGRDDFEQVGITGDDEEGTVEFSDLEPPDYLLTEFYPEGMEWLFVYSCTSDRRPFYAENRIEGGANEHAKRRVVLPGGTARRVSPGSPTV